MKLKNKGFLSCRLNRLRDATFLLISDRQGCYRIPSCPNMLLYADGVTRYVSWLIN